ASPFQFPTHYEVLLSDWGIDFSKQVYVDFFQSPDGLHQRLPSVMARRLRPERGQAVEPIDRLARRPRDPSQQEDVEQLLVERPGEVARDADEDPGARAKPPPDFV